MSKLLEQINKDKNEMTLGEVVTFHRGYDLPLTEIKKGIYPVVFSNGRMEYHSEFKVKAPGVYTGRSGSLGGMFYVEEDYWPHNTTLYVSDFHNNDTKYCYYFLSSFDFSKYNAGTGVPTLNRNHIHGIPVKIPSLPTQKKIAEILSAYDAKIENNNKIIKNLEATAQTIFNEWFVKFEFPTHTRHSREGGNLLVGYKSSGGKMVESELGNIPEGWGVKSVLDVIERISVGKKFENKTASPVGNVPILDQGASGFIGYHNEEPGVEASIENPVVVFTNHTCYYRLLTEPFSCIQNVLPYIGKNGYNTLFVYFLTKKKIKMSEYKGHWPEFEQQLFVVPPVKLANTFVSKIYSFISEMVILEKENVKLKESRDRLLAKLI